MSDEKNFGWSSPVSSDDPLEALLGGMTEEDLAKALEGFEERRAEKQVSCKHGDVIHFLPSLSMSPGGSMIPRGESNYLCNNCGAEDDKVSIAWEQEHGSPYVLDTYELLNRRIA